jgi:predicted amidophosphoribosyltransferase
MKKIPCENVDISQLYKLNLFNQALIQKQVDNVKKHSKGNKGHYCCLCKKGTPSTNFYCVKCSISFEFAFATCRECTSKEHHSFDLDQRLFFLIILLNSIIVSVLETKW